LFGASRVEGDQGLIKFRLYFVRVAGIGSEVDVRRVAIRRE
jgi:hypothetical protein